MNASVQTLLHSLIVTVVMCFWLFLLPTTAYCEVVLFSDDFEAGNADNWEIIEFGNAEVVDGTYCLLTF